MKLALALLLLCGAASVLAAPGEGNAPAAGGNEMTGVVATPAPLPQPANPGSAALPSAPTDSKSPEISKNFKDLSNEMTDVGNKVTQLSGGMTTAANQLKKIGEVHNMLKEAARRRKLRWREKYGTKPSKFSGRDGQSEDKFGQWKDRQFPETGVPAPKDGDSGVDPKAALGSDSVDKKMLADVLAKAKEVSPLADSVNDSLKNDLAQMAASLGGYDAHVKKINRKLDSAVSAARKKALKEQAMEKLHSAMSQSRLKIKELHERAKQLASVERTHKKNLRRKLKRLAQLHRQHVQKLIYRSRLQAMKLWLQHNRRKKLAKMMNQLKITQMYQQHKIDTQKAMSKSAKKLWKSFIGALQGHKGLRDESRKALESVERLHKRRMNKLKQEHQRKKAQIKRYVQGKYAAIMKSHFNKINDIRRKRQETLKVLSEEINRNREQKRRMERIVTDQESPSDQPEWETQLRERAARTRRLHKLYKAIQQQKQLRLTKMKIEKRLKESEEKQGDYFVDLRKKLNEKLTKLTEVIEANQAKIDEAIQFERKEWRNRMARTHLQKKVAELSNTITELKAGSHKDLPDAIRQGLEKEMAAQHHEKLRNARRAKRIAAADELKQKAPAFVEEEEDDSTTLTPIGEEDQTALAEHDDTMDDEDAFAADMPALMRELKSMKKTSVANPAAAGLERAAKRKGKHGTKAKAKKGKKSKKGKKKKNKRKRGKKKNKRRKGKRKGKKSKKSKKKGKKSKAKKSKKAKAKPKKRFAELEASEAADDESEGAESEEEEVEDTENAESSEASGPVDDQSEIMKGDDLKVWKEFQATPDASASAPQSEESENAAPAAQSKAQAVADAALAEASENDDDLMKEKPTPVKKAPEAPRAPTRFAAPTPVAQQPVAAPVAAAVERPADELVGICFKEVIEAKQQSANGAQSQAQKPSAPVQQQQTPAAAAPQQVQVSSAPRLRQVNRALNKEAGFDFSELIAETEPTVDLKHLLDGVLLETESRSSDPNQYCVNILRSYRQWRLGSVCGGDIACAAQCPASVCKVPPGVSVDKPRAPDAPKDVPPTWNYGQGGKDWNSGLCQSGRFQSPIMIEENRLNFTTNAREVRGNPFRVRTRYTPVMNLTLSHTNRYTIAILPQVQGSMGHALSGVDETNYHVTGLYFRAPSEHTFSSRINADNRRGDFPLELQIVHQKADGNGTMIFVVEFELKHTPGDNNFLASLGWRDLPRSVDQHRVIGGTVNLNDLSYSLDSDFYAYSGSSSTPDCAENVEYRVFTTPQGLTRAQLDTLTSLYTNSAEFPNGHGNNREIQPRNSRSIVKFVRHVYYNENTQRTEKRTDYHRTVQWVTATTQ